MNPLPPASPSRAYTRRRLLATGLAASLGSLAGCSQSRTVDQSPSTTPTTNGSEHSSGEATHEPTTEAAYLTRRDGTTYPFSDLPSPQTFDPHDSSTPRHPDSRSARVTVTETTADVEIGGIAIGRDLHLTLRIETPTDHWEFSETLPAMDDEDADFSTSHGHTFEEWRTSFDLQEIDIPLQAGCSVRAILHEMRSDDDDSPREGLLKHHQFIAIPYKNDTGSHVKWVNDESLNHNTLYTATKSERELPTKLHHTRIDTGDDITLFSVLYTHGRYWGVSTTIAKADFREYMDHYEADYWSDLSYIHAVYLAPERPHLSLLAESLWTAHTNVGLTETFDRLTATALFVQRMNYVSRGTTQFRHAPINVLMRQQGNCTEVTALYLSLLRCEPYGMNPAYIACDIVGLGPHMVAGIDVEEIGLTKAERADLHTFAPSAEYVRDGMPDTEYVFLELTAERSIGSFSTRQYRNVIVYDTANLDRRTQFRPR